MNGQKDFLCHVVDVVRGDTQGVEHATDERPLLSKDRFEGRCYDLRSGLDLSGALVAHSCEAVSLRPTASRSA